MMLEAKTCAQKFQSPHPHGHERSNSITTNDLSPRLRRGCNVVGTLAGSDVVVDIWDILEVAAGYHNLEGLEGSHKMARSETEWRVERASQTKSPNM